MSEVTDLIQEQKDANQEIERVSEHTKILRDIEDDLQLLNKITEEDSNNKELAIPKAIKSFNKVADEVKAIEYSPEVNVEPTTPVIEQPNITVDADSQEIDVIDPVINIPEMDTADAVTNVAAPIVDIPESPVEKIDFPEMVEGKDVDLSGISSSIQQIVETNTAKQEAANKALISYLDSDNDMLAAPDAQSGPIGPVTAEDNAVDNDAFYDSIEDGNEKVIYHLTSIDRTLKASLKELSTDPIEKGSTSGFGDSKSKEDDSGGGIMDSLTNLTGMGKMFGKGKMGKMLGKGMKFAKIGGAITGTVFLLKDLYQGFNDPKIIKNITGKAMKDLTGAEHSSASLANAIEGLSFGFIDAKDAFSFIMPAVDMMQKGIDHLFDPDIGIFGKFTTALFQLMDGDFGSAITNIVDGINEFPAVLFGKIDDITESLFGIDLDLSGKVTKAISFMADQLFDPEDGIFGGLYSIVSSFVEGDIMDGIKKALMFIPDAIKKAFGKISDVVGWITGGDVDLKKKASEAADAVSDTVSNAVGGVKDFFGFGDDEETAKPVSRTIESAVPVPTTPTVDMKSVPQAVNNNTVQMTKEKETNVVQAQVQPQPIIVQQPAPKEKKQVIRRTSDGDLSLGLMNASMMEG